MAYSLLTGATKDLVGLLLGHFPGSRRAAPRCRIALRVFTPSGMPAVELRCQ
jgi:hypothetical protein